jgi:hypothetical protein
MVSQLTDEERAELSLLQLASEKGKFAISIGHRLSNERQFALERLQERDWIRLIDVTPITTAGPRDLLRVFMLNAPALAFLKRHAN